jgi:Uma2 family endonuclease
MAVSYATYERVALEDTDGQWELVCGKLRERPLMTQEHNSIASRLARQLTVQLDEQIEIRQNAPSLRISSGTYLVPDVAVITPGLAATIAARPQLETYESALPFVAEVWSPSTGEYDVETKFPEYRARGDLEIWRIHPQERTVTAWRKQRDGTYAQTVHRDGNVPIASLPGVEIELARLFA